MSISPRASGVVPGTVGGALVTPFVQAITVVETSWDHVDRELTFLCSLFFNKNTSIYRSTNDITYHLLGTILRCLGFLNSFKEINCFSCFSFNRDRSGYNKNALALWRWIFITSNHSCIFPLIRYPDNDNNSHSWKKLDPISDCGIM